MLGNNYKWWIIDEWKWPAQKKYFRLQLLVGLGAGGVLDLATTFVWVSIKSKQRNHTIVVYAAFSRDFKLNPFCPEITPPPNPAFLFHMFSPKIELYIAEGDQLCQLHHLHLHSYPRRSLGGDNQIFCIIFIKRWWEMVVFTISIIMDYGSCGI